MMTSRDVALAQAFDDLGRSESTDFLRRVVSDGLILYSCDRFDFVQIRSATQ